MEISCGDRGGFSLMEDIPNKKSAPYDTYVLKKIKWRKGDDNSDRCFCLILLQRNANVSCLVFMVRCQYHFASWLLGIMAKILAIYVFSVSPPFKRNLITAKLLLASACIVWTCWRAGMPPFNDIWKNGSRSLPGSKGNTHHRKATLILCVLTRCSFWISRDLCETPKALLLLFTGPWHRPIDPCLTSVASSLARVWLWYPEQHRICSMCNASLFISFHDQLCIGNIILTYSSYNFLSSLLPTVRTVNYPQISPWIILKSSWIYSASMCLLSSCASKADVPNLGLGSPLSCATTAVKRESSCAEIVMSQRSGLQKPSCHANLFKSSTKTTILNRISVSGRFVQQPAFRGSSRFSLVSSTRLTCRSSNEWLLRCGPRNLTGTWCDE